MLNVAATRRMRAPINDTLKLIPTHKSLNYALIVDGEKIDVFLSLAGSISCGNVEVVPQPCFFLLLSPLLFVFIVCYVQHSFPCNLIYQPNRIE